jgi:E3 ubiquitin-protein ligase HERC1
LGLGRKTDKQFLTVPKTCSFNIQLSQVACGEDFTFMVTTQGLVYGMGSNQYGKLGFAVSKEGKDQVTPKLVDALAQHQIKQISCGLNHALAVTAESGVVYSWGCGNQGQLGR